MELEELLKQASNRDELNKLRVRLVYFNTIYNKYNPSNYNVLVNLGFGEIFGLSLLVNDPNATVEEVEGAIEVFDNYFEFCVGNHLRHFLNSVSSFYDKLRSSKTNTPIDFIEEFNKSKEKPTIDALVSIYENMYNQDDETAVGSVDKLVDTSEQFEPFVDMINRYTSKNKQIVIDWLGLLTLKGVQDLINELSVELSNRQQMMVRNEFHDKIIRITNHHEIFSRFNKYKSDTQKYINRQNKNINYCEDLYKRIKNGEKFTHIDPKWKDLSSEIQCLLVEKVLQEQTKRHEQLNDEENSLKKQTHIQEMLLKAGIHPSLINNIDSINLNEEQVQETLITFHQNGFPIDKIHNKDCLYLLLSSDKYSIDNIISYYKTKAININFLEQHINILKSKNEDNPDGLKEVVLENFKTLKDENATFSSKLYDSSILLIDSDILKEKIKLAREYGITLSSNKDVFTLIKNENSFDLLDFALEHQLPLDEVLKAGRDTEEIEPFMKRIVIAENFGFDVLTDEEEIPYNIMNASSFFIPQDKLDEVIENATPYVIDKKATEVLNNNRHLIVGLPNSIINDLDSKYLDEEGEVYNFDGTYISRNKVLRNYQALNKSLPNLKEEDAIYQAMIHNTILTNDQLDKIKKSINKVKEKKL